MTLKERFRWLVSAGIETHGDLIVHRRAVLTSTLLLMVICLFLFFAIYNFAISDFRVAILDVIAFTICGFAIWKLYFRKNLKVAINILINMLFVFFIALAITNQNNSYGLIWTFFFPMFVILLKGRKVGLYYTYVYYLILLTLAYLGIGEWQSGDWDISSFLRFSLASVLVVYSAYFNELSLETSYNELKDAIAREKHYSRELERLSITDPLTGLFNRRHYETLFRRFFNRAARQQEVFSFFILDVDYFKAYNDIYGHQSGDEALKRIARVLSDHMRREDDACFRIGGEEFGGVLITDTVDRALTALEQIRTAVEALQIQHSGNPVENVITVSIGASINQELSDTEEKDIYRNADEALYRAKSEGKNRISIS